MAELRATTKWSVANNENLLTAAMPGSLAAIRERTPSISSEISNPGSVASKTGEWSVSDRSMTQEFGPRLPERQHAGWKVSSDECMGNGKVDESKCEEANEQVTHEKYRKTQKFLTGEDNKKTTRSEEKTSRVSNFDRKESDGKKEKKKRLKKLKSAREKKSDEWDSEVKEKRKKYKRKKRKHAKDQLSDDDTKQNGELLNTSRDKILPKDPRSSSERDLERATDVKADFQHSEQFTKDVKQRDVKGIENGTSHSDIEKRKRKYRVKRNDCERDETNKKHRLVDEAKEDDKFTTRSSLNAAEYARRFLGKAKDHFKKFTEARTKENSDKIRLVSYSDDSSEDSTDCTRNRSKALALDSVNVTSISRNNGRKGTKVWIGRKNVNLE